MQGKALVPCSVVCSTSGPSPTVLGRICSPDLLMTTNMSSKRYNGLQQSGTGIKYEFFLMLLQLLSALIGWADLQPDASHLWPQHCWEKNKLQRLPVDFRKKRWETEIRVKGEWKKGKVRDGVKLKRGKKQKKKNGKNSGQGVWGPDEWVYAVIQLMFTFFQNVFLSK